MILTLFCAAPAFSESIPIDITPEYNEHAGVRFAVFTEPQMLKHDQFRESWVVVTVTPTDKSAMSQTAYVEVWDGNQHVYSGDLPSCKPTDIPDSLRKQVEADGTILFSFRINPTYLTNTRFFYQIENDAPDGEPTYCVILFGNYMKAQQSVPGYPPQGVGSPEP